MKKNANSYETRLNASYIFLGLFFVFYEMLSSIFMYFPYFYGLYFCYAFYLLQEQEKSLARLDFRFYFCVVILLFTDITHNFFVFSSWLGFLIFYYFLADFIKTNLKIGTFLAVIFTICTYVLIFCIDWILSYIANLQLKSLSLEMLINTLIEALIAHIFFKDKF